jgi:non-specific protein-tyrosine kinase
MRWYWLLILAAMLAAVTAFLVSKRMTPVYQASTKLLVNEAPTARNADYNSILTSERLARTYSEMLTTNPVIEGVIKDLGLNLEAKELQKSIQVELLRDTQLIEVKVDNTNPVVAANIANMLVSKFSEKTTELQASRYASSKQNLETQLARIDEQIQNTADQLNKLKGSTQNQTEIDRLDTALAQYRQTYASLLQSYEQVRVAEAGSTSNVVQIEPATVPERPIRPRTLMNTSLAGIIGMIIAAGVILLIEALDDTIRGPDDIARVLKIPVLGLIIRHETSDGNLVSLVQPRSPVSESFRSLRTNLQFASVDTPLHVLLITSPSPSDGKTTIAANLGIVMAQGGRQVVMVDADMRRPRIHKMFDIPNRVGLSGMFVQTKIKLDGSLQKTSTEGLMALPAGELPPNPAELLGSEKLIDIFNQIGQQADMVIIDSPPLMAVTDSAVLAHRVDGVLLVIKPGTTKTVAAKQAVEQLQRVGANVLGVVLNEVDFSRSRYAYYHYKGYYYTYQYYYNEQGRKVKRKMRSKKEQPVE